MKENGILRTAAAWCRKLNISILDPDGWDYENAAADFFEKPITRAEFNTRLSTCTILTTGFEQKIEDRLKRLWKSS